MMFTICMLMLGPWDSHRISQNSMHIKMGLWTYLGHPSERINRDIYIISKDSKHFFLIRWDDFLIIDECQVSVLNMRTKVSSDKTNGTLVSFIKYIFSNNVLIIFIRRFQSKNSASMRRFFIGEFKQATVRDSLWGTSYLYRPINLPIKFYTYFL